MADADEVAAGFKRHPALMRSSARCSLAKSVAYSRKRERRLPVDQSVSAPWHRRRHEPEK
jgi:hypothetical protein